MSVGHPAGSPERSIAPGLVSALAAFVRDGLAASARDTSLDQEDRIYADGFAAGERGEAWLPPDLDAAQRHVWNEGYRDGRHGRHGAGRRARGRLPIARTT